jgi:hypothetical protein
MAASVLKGRIFLRGDDLSRKTMKGVGMGGIIGGIYSKFKFPSLIELEEVEVAEVCEPEMDRVRELLRFDDGPKERQLLFGEEEVDLMKPVSSGLNLLKHSNELDAFGLTVFEQTKQSKGPNKG